MEKIIRKLKIKAKKKPRKSFIPLEKRINRLPTIVEMRTAKLQAHIKTQILTAINKQRLNKFAKLLIYYFARGFYFQIHAFRVIQRIMQKQKLKFKFLNVNSNIDTKGLHYNRQ